MYWLRTHAFLAWVLIVAMLLAEVPLGLAACCAPPGARGLGSVWFINDFAQYESALRQGAQLPGWFIYDVFTPEAHQPTLMFTLYVAIGKAASLLRVDALLLERIVEFFSRGLLVVSLWRFCRAFAATESVARAAMLLALFGSGFEVFAALIGQGAVSTGTWSYETNTFGLLFAAPHVALAMAATLELARLALADRPLIDPWRARAGYPGRAIVTAALLSCAIALLHPFHLPVLLAAILLLALLRRSTFHTSVAVAAGLGALPVLTPTLLTFTHDPFWSATYAAQNILPSPSPPALLVELGITLLLAVVAAALMRARVAPTGLIVWLVLAMAAMYAPVPYQRRLSFGFEPALAVVAAAGFVEIGERLGRVSAVWFRLAVAALAVNGTLLVGVSVVASGLTNAPLPIYRSTVDLDAGAAWLDQHARSGDVILADWAVSNYLAPRTPARVVGGHPVATLDAPAKQSQIAAAFTGSLDVSSLARTYGANWIVYGPSDVVASPDTSAMPVFSSGRVRIYRLADLPGA